MRIFEFDQQKERKKARGEGGFLLQNYGLDGVIRVMCYLLALVYVQFIYECKLSLKIGRLPRWKLFHFGQIQFNSIVDCIMRES